MKLKVSFYLHLHYFKFKSLFCLKLHTFRFRDCWRCAAMAGREGRGARRRSTHQEASPDSVTKLWSGFGFSATFSDGEGGEEENKENMADSLNKSSEVNTNNLFTDDPISGLQFVPAASSRRHPGRS